MVVGLLVQSLPCDVILEYKQIVKVAEPGEGPESPPPPTSVSVKRTMSSISAVPMGPVLFLPEKNLGGGGQELAYLLNSTW